MLETIIVFCSIILSAFVAGVGITYAIETAVLGRNSKQTGYRAIRYRTYR